MWLIIPKNEPADIQDWGLTQDIEDFIGLRDTQATDTLRRYPCPPGETGYNFILRKLTQCEVEVWVLDPRSRVVAGVPPPTIPDALANAVTKVFVHFGGTASRDMNLLWIEQQWNETKETLILPEMFKAAVLPISSQGGVAWQQQIADFRVAFTSGQPFGIEYLKSAWSTAEQHFYKLLPIRRVVETLFPYYVDACHYVSLDPDEWMRAQSDVANANRFAREAVASVRQSPDFGERSDPELTGSLESIFNQVLPEKAGVTKEALNNFIASYKSLSTKYTKRVLNPDVVEKQQEQPEAAPEK